ITDVRVVAEEGDFDLRRVFHDVVVREDVAVLADDEPRAGRARGLLLRRLTALTVAAAAGRGCLIVLAARSAEETVEEIIRRSAATEQIGEVLSFRLHLGPDVDDDRRRRFGDVAEGL